MKSTTTIVAATVALLSSAHALTPEQNAQVNVVVQDIRGHLNEYLEFANSHPEFHIPDGLMDVYTKAATYTDTSYTTLFDEVNMDQFTQAVTQLPWYSERIMPSLVPGAQGAAPTPAPAPAAPAPAPAAPAPAAPAPAAPAPAAPAPAAPAPAAPAPAATTAEGSGSGGNSESQPSASSNSSSSARPSASAAGNGTNHSSTSSGSRHSTSSSRGSGGQTSVSTTRAAGNGQSLQALSTGFGIVAAGIAGLLL